ncbi:hypothetical protein ACS0TY_022129 [Phlomoides rotata]
MPCDLPKGSDVVAPVADRSHKSLSGERTFSLDFNRFAKVCLQYEEDCGGFQNVERGSELNVICPGLWSELQMVKVLFGLNSLASYLEKGVLPSSMEDLPYPMKVVVEACIRKEWNRVGKQAYFEILHPLIISILCTAPQKSSTAAASVLLIGSSEEFGVPITVHQVATVNNLGSGNYRTDDRLE